jgi:hypothetical protein
MNTYQISYKGNSKRVHTYNIYQALKIGLITWRAHNPLIEDIEVKFIKKGV